MSMNLTDGVQKEENQKYEQAEDQAPQLEAVNEFVLANLLLLDAVQLLEYLCIWIVDTAVMVHMAPYAVGMVHNAYENLNWQAITISNGIQDS